MFFLFVKLLSAQCYLFKKSIKVDRVVWIHIKWPWRMLFEVWFISTSVCLVPRQAILITCNDLCVCFIIKYWGKGCGVKTIMLELYHKWGQAGNDQSLQESKKGGRLYDKILWDLYSSNDTLKVSNSDQNMGSFALYQLKKMCSFPAQLL